MVEVGVSPRLMESEGGAAEIEAVDLRTPQSKARVEPSKEQRRAGPDRPRRAVRPPSRYTVGENSAEGDAEDDAEEDMEEEGQSNDGGSDEGGDKGAEETVEQLPEVPLPRDNAFQKRAAKKKGRKRVSRRLLEGNSDEEEGKFSDDEQLAKEGDPLETVVEAGPSALWEWKGVESGDARTNLQPAPWQGSRSRVPRTLLSNLATLNPFQIFLLLVPLSFWQWAVEQTNLYAQVSRDDAPPTEKGRERPWVPVTVQELLHWAGIVFLMALHPLPALSDYWRQGRLGNIVFLDTGKIMLQNRFEQIKRYFHLADNAQRPPQKDTKEHRLWQILQLVKVINETFKKLYNLSQYVTFDERTVPLHNKACPVRIYNPKKPHKFKIEIFAAVDGESLLCWHQHIYDKLKTPDLHEKMVELLAGTLERDKGHVIILDRGFTGPVVLKTLLEMGFQATGTCVVTRKNFLANVVKLPGGTERGSVSAAICNSPEMVAFCWMDKQPVFFVTTSHSLVMGETGRRSGSVVDRVPCPEAAYVYNKYKDGVDQFDKSCLGQNYSLEMEMVSRKWWHKLFWGLLDSAVSNAYILFRIEHPEVSRFDFYVILQDQLVTNTMDMAVLARSTSTKGGGSVDLSKHSQTLIPNNKRRRCAMCSLKKRKLDIEEQGEVCYRRYWCKDCEKGFYPDKCLESGITLKSLRVGILDQRGCGKRSDVALAAPPHLVCIVHLVDGQICMFGSSKMMCSFVWCFSALKLCFELLISWVVVYHVFSYLALKFWVYAPNICMYMCSIAVVPQLCQLHLASGQYLSCCQNSALAQVAFDALLMLKHSNVLSCIKSGK
jgi:hypothetical protein